MDKNLEEILLKHYLKKEEDKDFYFDKTKSVFLGKIEKTMSTQYKKVEKKSYRSKNFYKK